MSYIKTFKVEDFQTGADITVEIDFEFKWNTKPALVEPFWMSMEESLKNMVFFWTGGEARLETNDGNVVVTFLQQLLDKVIRLSADYNHGLSSMIEEFEDLEGWCKMNGEYGIKLIDFTAPDFAQENFTVEEAK